MVFVFKARAHGWVPFLDTKGMLYKIEKILILLTPPKIKDFYLLENESNLL